MASIVLGNQSSFDGSTLVKELYYDSQVKTEATDVEAKASLLVRNPITTFHNADYPGTYRSHC